MAKKTFRIIERVIDRQTRSAIARLRVEAWDKDLIFDDLVGSAVTDEQGAFQMEFDQSYFQELFLGRQPDLFFKVFRESQLIKSTEDSILWNVRAGETKIVIEVDMPTILDEKVLSRCGPGIRRLLRMKEEEIIRAKEEDEKRMMDAMIPIKEGEEKREPLDGELLHSEPGVLPHPVFGPIIVDKLEKIPIRIEAIVDFAGNTDDLKTMGIKVHSHVQDIFTVTATREQLVTLASLPATRKIEQPRLFLPNLKDVVPLTEIDQIHAVGHRGNGTIVGIVDTTLDVEHYAFRIPNNPHKTRVQYLWIQAPDTGPGGTDPAGQTPAEYTKTHSNSPDFSNFTKGRLYDAEAINKAIASGNIYGIQKNQIAKKPGVGEHGTKVAGIAVGGGHLNNWKPSGNVGSAPLADIVYVDFDQRNSGLKDGTWETNAIDALNFILAVAGKKHPVVINNSYGSNLGPHNGKISFDKMRNAMLDSHEGRSLVFAVGNDNDNEGFSRGEIDPQQKVTIDMTLIFKGTPMGKDRFLEIWYEGGDLDYKIDSGTYSTQWQTYPSEVLYKEKNREISVSTDKEPISQLKNLRLYIQGPPTDPYPTPSWNNDWKIQLNNNSKTTKVKYWAWAAPQGQHANLTPYSIDEMTLQDTSCSRELLSVGACNKPAGGKPEMIANYSSRGPTLDDSIKPKPEIVTVGSYVITAISTTVHKYSAIGCGTSFAAPVVAGAISLLFENNPKLNQDTIKDMLTKDADKKDLNIDPKKPMVFDEIEYFAYGNGRLRMLAPFGQSFSNIDVDVWVKTAKEDYGYKTYKGNIFWLAPEVKIFDANGNETTTLKWGKKHKVQVKVYNNGQTPAMKTKVSLKYTRPETAPDEWEECKDSDNESFLKEEVNIPALDSVALDFKNYWVPDESKFPPGGAQWGDHYCLLVELDHPQDPLQYDDKTTKGKDPWEKNIKGTNNIALRNLHIH